MKHGQVLKAIVLGLGLALALAWVLEGGSLPILRAADYPVTKYTDSADGTCDADCSLREAIIAANNNAV